MQRPLLGANGELMEADFRPKQSGIMLHIRRAQTRGLCIGHFPGDLKRRRLFTATLDLQDSAHQE